MHTGVTFEIQQLICVDLYVCRKYNNTISSLNSALEKQTTERER